MAPTRHQPDAPAPARYYHENIARSLLKAPKYFYDTGQVGEDKGKKLEKLTACTLLKEIHRLSDIYGESYEQHYIRTRNGYEIDVLVTGEKGPDLLLEVKWCDDQPSRNFARFAIFSPTRARYRS
ncbi:MAG: hypothetical protein JW781_07840 [Deltaproteobacteria bacterium]|nr:hypothetical protein [Candidatus Anaeroferrophillacea bacterium]